MTRDLQSVLDGLLDGVLVVNARGDLERVNSEACRILDISAETAEGRGALETLGADHVLARLAQTVLDGGGSAGWSECPLEGREGDLVVDVAGSPLFDAAGRLDGAVLVVRDRTIKNSLRDVVSEREQLDSFGRIASGIAHEIRNPLGGIRGAGEILGARAADAKTRNAAELIVREVDRISTLIDDLMVFSRGDELQLDAVNLHRILDDVLDLLVLDPIAERATLQRVFDPSIPDLHADRNRLSQVFLNLARNALQASEDGGGRLTITTRMQIHRRLSSPGEARAPSVEVLIADQGRGMSPEVLQQAATPFFTTRPGGTGLGLAVAHHWVRRHGGTLRLESSAGGGTTACVVLPLRSAA